jgi:hypothetical protein
VQLGQGVTAVTACDSAISVVPVSAMRALGNPETEVASPTPSAGPLTDVFTVGSIEVGKIQGIADACDGKVFKIQIYNYNGATSSALSCDEIEIAKIDGSGYAGDASDYDCTDDLLNGGAFYVKLRRNVSTPDSNKFTISLKSGLSGNDVDYITLETTEHSFGG